MQTRSGGASSKGSLESCHSVILETLWKTLNPDNLYDEF